MGRKGTKPKLLMCLMAASAIVTGIIGSVSMPVKAAEEENYTVTFEAYEGTCEAESITVPKGESLTLPEAYYEGHYLESWMDVTEEESSVVKQTAVGKAGDIYTPERDMWLYANWKPEQAQDITVIYEARIGDTRYEELEEAFANAQAGDTITVLKDCSVSGTLEVTLDNITLRSEDAGNPATISREEEFAGIKYSADTDTVLVAVNGGSFSSQDIILDGGAALDSDFNNSGKAWNSPLVYVTGSYDMGSGTVLQNNYNTDGYVSSGGRPRHTGGAVHIVSGGSLSMEGGLIQNCYSSGAGGGVQSVKGSVVTAVSTAVRNCYATWGGGMSLWGEADLSGMTFTGNVAGSSGGAVSSIATLTVTDSLIEGNRSAYDGGGICTATGHRPKFIRCTFTGNTAPRGSAVQTTKGEGPDPLEIHDCTFTGNLSGEKILAGGTICYMNETGIILSGNIVMEDNLTVGISPCDILFMYNTGASILLDEDFESDSTFVIGGYEDVKPGRVLIDGKLYNKEPSTEQFVWHTEEFCTERIGENLYLAEVPETYFIGYDANNNDSGLSHCYIGTGRYTGKDTVTILDREGVYPYMGSFEKKGCDFVCWNTRKDGTGTDYFGGEEILLTENTYLFAKWEAKEPVTLTYIYNGGTGAKDSEQAVPGLEFIFPDAERSGYSFKGWYEDEALTAFAGNAGEVYDAPGKDTTYYAAWEKADATVTFDADGGKMEGGNVSAKIGDTITLPACTKDGYEFVGWYDNGTCAGQAGENYTVTGDVTLKACYEKKETPEERPEATITFDADGGEMESGDVIAKVGDTITLPACTKDGYEFVGWYDNDTCAGQAGEDYTVTGDVTLKARYEKKETPEERQEATITFDADGGEMEGGDVTAKVGDTITLPACTKDGYEFVGWYDNDTSAGQAGEGYTVTGDVVLKARYEKKAETTYLITFDPNGGRKAGHIRAAKGEKITLPGTEKTGYIFLGWYTEKDGGILLGIAGDELEVTKDMTVYALWEKERSEETGDKEPETCKAVFHTGGGTLKNETFTVVKGTGLYLPLPAEKGYDFAGWYLDKSLTQFAGTYRDSYRITKDTDFYAKWEKVKEDDSNNDADQGSNAETKGTYTVKYDANGGTVKESSVKVEKGAGIKLPTAEREGFSFAGWYTDKQVLVGKAGSTYKPDQDITLYAKWEKADAGDNDGNTEDRSESDTKTGISTADAGTDNKTGSSMPDGGQDVNTDISAEKAVGTQTGTAEAKNQKEPVIQTGRITPIYLFAAVGMFGVLLAALSIREGKRSSEK